MLYDTRDIVIENVVFAPRHRWTGGLSLDEGDVQDFRNRLPFVLTTEEVPEYNILYVGQQQEDAVALLRFRYRSQTDRWEETLFSGTHLGG